MSKPPHRGCWVLAGMVALWAGVFGVLVSQRHDRFTSAGFDTGIFDQATWLLSRFGDQFITVRGLPVFGHHANLALYFLVPFYWLGAGPHFLNLVQVGALALGAVPVFLLARDHLGRPWLAVGLAIAYLLHPSTQYLASELFHPEVMAITPLLFAYWFATRERWRWFAACAVLAAAWKEDVSLAVIMLGVVVAARGHRRVGLATASLALTWFVFVTAVLLPTMSGSRPFYLSEFSYLGDTPGTMLMTALSHPSLLVRRVLDLESARYVLKLTAPLACLSFVAPGALSIGGPQVLVNVLSTRSFTKSILFHYAAMPLVGVVLGGVEGITRLGKTPCLRRILVGLAVVASLAATIAWGPSPIGTEFRRGWWAPSSDFRRPAKEAALAVVPDDAAVTASYQLVPHLTHRRHIYEFPNPFVPTNWGIHNENYPSPSAVDWLAVDTALISGNDRRLLEQLLSSGDFTVRYQRLAVVVAQRVGTTPPRATSSNGLNPM